MGFKDFPVLRLFFNEPAAQTPQQIEHERQLARLSNFMSDLPKRIKEEFEETLSAAGDAGVDIKKLAQNMGHGENIFQRLHEKCGMSLGGYSFSIDVDGAAYSREELAGLTEQIVALHDVAAAYNVDIQFAGFDRLPRKATAVRHSATRHISTMINFSPRDTYNAWSHPDYSPGDRDGEDKIKSTVNSRFIRPKPQGPNNQNIGSGVPRI